MRFFVCMYVILCFTFYGCRSLSNTQEIEINSQSVQNAGTDSIYAGSIIGVAVSSGSFHKFTSIIQKVGLNHMLAQDGPYTLFAPTDEAFELFSEETFNELLKPKNKAKLSNLIKYHIVAGEIWTDSLQRIENITTAQGTDLAVNESEHGITINNAHVVKQNIKADNGVIQIIDRVLQPASY